MLHAKVNPVMRYEFHFLMTFQGVELAISCF